MTLIIILWLSPFCLFHFCRRQVLYKEAPCTPAKKLRCKYGPHRNEKYTFSCDHFDDFNIIWHPPVKAIKGKWKIKLKSTEIYDPRKRNNDYIIITKKYFISSWFQKNTHLHYIRTHWHIPWLYKPNIWCFPNGISFFTYKKCWFCNIVILQTNRTSKACYAMWNS